MVRASKCLPLWHDAHVEEALATTQGHFNRHRQALESSEADAKAEMMQVLTDHVTKQFSTERSAIDKMLQDGALKNEAYNQAVVEENRELKLKVKSLELKCQTTQAECLDWKHKFETAEKVVSERSAIVDSLSKKHEAERKADVAQAYATFEHEKFELQSLLKAHLRQSEHHEVQAESRRTLIKSLEATLSELREKLNSKDQQLRTKDHLLLAKDHELQSKGQELQSMDQSLQAKDEQLQAYVQEIKIKDETISQQKEASETTIKESNEKLEMLLSNLCKERAALSSQASDWEQAILSHAANSEHLVKQVRESGSKHMQDMTDEVSKLSEENVKLRHDSTEARRRWQSYEKHERPALNKLVEKLQLEKAQAKAKEEAAHCDKRRSHVHMLTVLSQVHGVMAHHFGDGVKAPCAHSPDASTVHSASEEEECARDALEDSIESSSE